MSAIDYLRRLQASLPHSGGIPDEILKQRIRQSKDYAAEIGTFQPSFENDERFYREELINPFLSCLPVEEVRDLHQIPVGFLPIYEPNAWAMQTPEGDYLIVMHTEMRAVLSYYKELQAATLEMYEKHNAMDKSIKELHSGMGQLHEQHEIDSAKKYFEEVFKQLEEQEIILEKLTDLNRDCFKIIFDSFQHKRSVDFPPIPVTVSEKRFMNSMLATMGSELFIIVNLPKLVPAISRRI